MRLSARTVRASAPSRSGAYDLNLGDEVTLLPGKCPCGSALLRVAAVAGRRDDDFLYGNSRVPASAFRHVLGSDPAISEYQVSQTATGAEIAIVGSPDPGQLRTELVQSLRRYGLSKPEIAVKTVSRIERHAATGKFKRFVPLS